MTLAEDRELEVVKAGLTYVTKDSHSKEPHWHALVEDPLVGRSSFSTKQEKLRIGKQLAKEPEWKVTLPKYMTWSIKELQLNYQKNQFSTERG